MDGSFRILCYSSKVNEKALQPKAGELSLRLPLMGLEPIWFPVRF